MKAEHVDCRDRRTAHRRCPWAAKVVKVEGGFRCFESIEDYRIWKAQR